MDSNLRKVSVLGHQEFWCGWLHDWTRGADGVPAAIIEDEYGKVHVEAAYKVKFVDPIGKA